MESDVVKNLLAQVFEVHQSIREGLETQIEELKGKVVSLEQTISRFSKCDRCKRMKQQSPSPKPEKQNNQSGCDEINDTLHSDLEDIFANKEEFNDTEEEKEISCEQEMSMNNIKTQVDTFNDKESKRHRNFSPLLFDDDESKSWKAKKRRLQQVTLDNSFSFAVERRQATKSIQTSQKQDKNISPLIRTENEVDKNLLLTILHRDEVDNIISPSRRSNDTTSKSSSIYNGSLDPTVQFLDDEINDQSLIPKETEHRENKYKGDVVRKQSERNKLKGFGCKECKDYFENLGLNSEEIKERMNQCSRHRDNFSPPSTPRDFWSVEFPSTQESKKNGDLNTTQYRPLKSRRRRL